MKNTIDGDRCMRNNIKSIFLQLSLFLIWGLFMLIQHIAAFDVFDSNSWHLYLIACIAALHHYLIVYFSKKVFNFKILLWICGILYTIGSCAKIMQLILVPLYQPYPLGLTVLCFVLDAVGVLIIVLKSRQSI